MRQVLVTFRDEASEAEVQSYVTTIRHLRHVARVELVSAREAAGLPRSPTADESNPDITVRGDEMFFKGPDGALLARLTAQEAEVIHLLTRRRKARLGPIERSKELLAALRQASPGMWGAVKSVSTATDAYASAREKLVGTEWELIDKPRGTYGFKQREDDA